MEKFELPESRYGPFFNKVLIDFKEYHKVPITLPLPEPCLKPHHLLSRILDIIVWSMGESKRGELLKELEEYKQDLDATE